MVCTTQGKKKATSETNFSEKFTCAKFMEFSDRIYVYRRKLLPNGPWRDYYWIKTIWSFFYWLISRSFQCELLLLFTRHSIFGCKKKLKIYRSRSLTMPFFFFLFAAYQKNINKNKFDTTTLVIISITKSLNYFNLNQALSLKLILWNSTSSLFLPSSSFFVNVWFTILKECIIWFSFFLQFEFN